MTTPLRNFRTDALLRARAQVALSIIVAFLQALQAFEIGE